jgi:hypothetical protein
MVENNDWDEACEMDWDDNNVDFNSNLNLKKSSSQVNDIKVLDPSKDIRPALEQRIESTRDLYGLDFDQMIILAR